MSDFDEAQFEKANKILKSIIPSYRYYYKCPVCLKDFYKSEIRNNICRGHIIPPKMNNIGYIYVCKKCDNYIGSEIESSIVNLINHTRILNGSREGKSQFRNYLIINGKRFLIRLSSNLQEIKIENVKPFDDMNLESLDISNLRLTIEAETDLSFDKWKRFYFKIAYYACYAKYGYAYFINESGFKNTIIEEIRDYIVSDKVGNQLTRKLLIYQNSVGKYKDLFGLLELKLPEYKSPIMFINNVLVFMPPSDNESIVHYQAIDFRKIKIKLFPLGLDGESDLNMASNNR